MKAGDTTALISAIEKATILHVNTMEGTGIGQYAVGSKAVLKNAIDAAQLKVDNVASKTAQQLADAEATFKILVDTFENSKVVALTGLVNVIIEDTATDSSNRLTLENGETLVLISSDITNAVVTVTNDSNGTIKVTGVAAGGTITVTVQVQKDGQMTKTGIFTVTTIASALPVSMTSKPITNLDFPTVQATQAKLVSKPVTVNDFNGNRKEFTIKINGDSFQFMLIGSYQLNSRKVQRWVVL